MQVSTLLMQNGRICIKPLHSAVLYYPRARAGGWAEWLCQACFRVILENCTHSPGGGEHMSYSSEAAASSDVPCFSLRVAAYPLPVVHLRC